MARWLVTAVDQDGQKKAILVNDSTNSALPFGDHSDFCDRIGVSEFTLIVELPEGDFRPEVIDPAEDTEIAMIFLDL